jgi:acetyl esterase/lipase
MHAPRLLVVALVAPVYRYALNARVDPRRGRRVLEATSPVQLRLLPKGTVLRRTTLGGRPCERTTVGATRRPRAVLYLHGGGYTVGSPRVYRAAAAHLAATTGAVVYNLDYRLAPEYPFPAAWQDAVAAFRELVTVRGYEPGQVAIAGDSAGGGLAVAAARTLTDEGLRPGALALFSPWTDPSDTAFERERDFVTNRAWGKASAAMYRGSADAADPRYAPLHGDLAGLPPMLIHYAPEEILAPQVERFAAAASAAGVEVELVRLDRLWHSALVLAGTLRTATRSVRAAGAYVQARLGDATPAVRAARTA